jgi:hypothetical protein
MTRWEPCSEEVLKGVLEIEKPGESPAFLLLE